MIVTELKKMIENGREIKKICRVVFFFVFFLINSIKKTFDLIHVHYGVLCNISARAQLGLGMISQT